MTRIINRPVAVNTSAQGSPMAFTWQGHHRVVRVLDVWREAGCWWEGEGERVTYRVITDRGGMFELTCEPDRGRWLLYKTYD